ncbi:hypothetical protein BDD12DRAFT_982686 [Trichophaea hybrida]|nr:hypothetical protein BDD12DRAFT_982686 [Trichophaea hybrida]
MESHNYPSRAIPAISIEPDMPDTQGSSPIIINSHRPNQTQTLKRTHLHQEQDDGGASGRSRYSAVRPLSDHPFPVIDTKLTLRGCSDTLLPMLPPSRKKSSREHCIRTFKGLFNSTPSPPSTPLLPIRHNAAMFRVAFQARNGCAVLYLVELTEDGSGRDFIRALRAKRKEVMIPCTCKYFWKVVIETAIAEPINNGDLEGQTLLEVNLRNSAPNPWLTHAFYNPETLGRPPNMTDFKVEGGSNLSAPMKTLVIKTVFNKPMLLLLLLFAAIVAGWWLHM